MRTLIIGIGNDFRGDDAVGFTIIRKLTEQKLPAEIVEASGEGGALINLWTDFERVILVDAVKSNGTAGMVTWWNAKASPLPREIISASTHNFGALEAIELARALNKLPEELYVLGVEVQSCTVGSPLSMPVQLAASEAVGMITALLKEKICESNLA